MAQSNEVNPATWSPLLADLYLNNYRKLVFVAERILHDRSLAEDCVQDAFMAFHVKQSAPATGRELGYLRSMVRNGAISMLRRERRQLDVALAGDVAVEASAESRAVARLAAHRISEGVAKLAPRQGAVVAHRFLGRSVAETADMMAVTSGTVKTHRHRAAEAMRIALADVAAA